MWLPCPSTAQLEPKQMSTLEGTAHQHAQSCCPARAKVLLPWLQGTSSPAPSLCHATSEGWKEGGRSCSGAADLGKSGCQAVLGLLLCGETHRSCHCCSAVGLVCPGQPCSANPQRAQGNGLLPRVCRMHAWQRELGRWNFFNFSILPGWRKESQDQHPSVHML